MADEARAVHVSDENNVNVLCIVRLWPQNELAKKTAGGTAAGAPRTAPHHTTSTSTLPPEVAARKADVDSRSVIVQNLPPNAADDLLAAHFGCVGVSVFVVHIHT
jgi:hypothetical protein